jgi:hypothetical protein
VDYGYRDVARRVENSYDRNTSEPWPPGPANQKQEP